MHINTKECSVETARRHQRDMAVQSALALRQQFTVHGDVLERVEVFRYLGRLLSQDDDDIQAVRSQLCKARGTWAWVGQVLRRENAPKLKCPSPLCKGELASGWMMRRHFRYLHPLDYVVVKKEGRYP
jgi:hypothetical protein